MMKYSSFSFLFFYNFCFLLQRLTSYINQFFSDSISFQLNIFKFFFVNVLNLLSLRLCFIVDVGSVRHMKEAVGADHKSLVPLIVLVQTTLITVQILRAPAT